MPVCYGNRKFRGNRVFYYCYFQNGIVYCRKYQFYRGFIYSAHLKSQIVQILQILVFGVAMVT